MAANPNSDSHSLIRSCFLGKKTAAEETTTRRNPQMFPSVHESELSERNKNRGRCNFFSVFAKEGEGEGNQPVVLRSPARRVVCHLNCVGSAVADEFLLRSAEMQCYYLS